MQSNRSLPPSQVIPELAYPDVGAASDWLCKAFGFSPRLRIANHRVQLTYGGGAVIVVNGDDVNAEAAARATHSVLVRVDNVDAHHERARAAGAKIASLPTTYPFGERQYSARDPYGHRWTFSQSVADVDPRDWGGSLIANSDAP
ncbi:MAG TPA: VOC family protein [Gammaproteobacteria bacterium]|nr:VOC family protein [Gammaproteobacteria bacterium]